MSACAARYELDEYNFKDAPGDLFSRFAPAGKVPRIGNVGEDREDRVAVVYDHPASTSTRAQPTETELRGHGTVPPHLG